MVSGGSATSQNVAPLITNFTDLVTAIASAASAASASFRHIFGISPSLACNDRSPVIVVGAGGNTASLATIRSLVAAHVASDNKISHATLSGDELLAVARGLGER